MKDIKLDQFGDLDLSSGDIQSVESKENHIQDVLMSEKGYYGQFPLVGFGLRAYVNSPINSRIRRTIEKELTLQLQYDGAINVDVDFVDESIQVNADYE